MEYNEISIVKGFNQIYQHLNKAKGAPLCLKYEYRSRIKISIILLYFYYSSIFVSRRMFFVAQSQQNLYQTQVSYLVLSHSRICIRLKFPTLRSIAASATEQHSWFLCSLDS